MMHQLSMACSLTIVGSNWALEGIYLAIKLCIIYGRATASDLEAEPIIGGAADSVIYLDISGPSMSKRLYSFKFG